jgi:hypothetical protein
MVEMNFSTVVEKYGRGLFENKDGFERASSVASKQAADMTTETPYSFQPSSDERKRMTAAAAAHDEDMRQLVAERIAFWLVENTNSYRRRYFFVLDDRKPVPFPRHWNYKNTTGVTFGRADVDAARAWVKQALLAGFTVFYSNRKHGWGRGAVSKMASTAKMVGGCAKNSRRAASSLEGRSR